MRTLKLFVVMTILAFFFAAHPSEAQTRKNKNAVEVPGGSTPTKVTADSAYTRVIDRCSDKERPTVVVREIVFPQYNFNPYVSVSGFGGNQHTSTGSLDLALKNILLQAGCNPAPSALKRSSGGGFGNPSTRSNMQDQTGSAAREIDYSLNLNVQEVSGAIEARNLLVGVFGLSVERSNVVGGGTYRIQVEMPDANGIDTPGSVAMIEVSILTLKEKGRSYSILGVVGYGTFEGSFTQTPAVEAATQALPFLFGLKK